jgi:nucleotide-binding universal stress UspA family protein
VRTLLVAFDGSEPANRALDFALRQAQRDDETLLHVLAVQAEVRTYGEIDVYVGEERMHALAAEQTRARLDSARASLQGLAHPPTLELLDGDPAATIVRRADELGCESIVMGTRGLGRLGSTLLGSVAQRVVHAANVPVTLVK